MLDLRSFCRRERPFVGQFLRDTVLVSMTTPDGPSNRQRQLTDL
jgi:hypothetical protein